MLLNIDVKSLELVVTAWLSNDVVMLQELRDKIDLHSENQKAFSLPERVIAKIFVFRIIYGGNEYSFAYDPDFTSVSSSKKYWKEVIDKFYNKYKGIAIWHKHLVELALKGKYVSPFGRKWTFSFQDKVPETLIKNYIVQGTGADCVSIIRVMIYKELQRQALLDEVKLFNTVHDSIEIDLPEKYVDKVEEIVYKSFSDFPLEVKRRFNVDFPLELSCEIQRK